MDLYITIDKETCQMLINNTIGINGILPQHIINQELNTSLLDLHTRNGNPSVISCEINPAKTKFDLSTLKGSFTLSYTLEYFFACDGIANTQQYTDEFQLSFDKQSLTFSISNPIKWELDN